MGLAVLPARLQKWKWRSWNVEFCRMRMRESDLTKTHADWAEKWMPNYEITEENIHAIVQKEIELFLQKFWNVQVFIKRTPEGKAAFQRFLDCI